MKTINLEITKCEECPYCKFDEGDCYPDEYICNHPKDYRTLAVYRHYLKGFESSEYYDQLWDGLPPSWCSLNEKEG